MPTPIPDFLNMSDEEFSKLGAPTDTVAPAPEPKKDEPAEPPAEKPKEPEAPAADEKPEPEAEGEPSPGSDPEPEAPKDDAPADDEPAPEPAKKDPPAPAVDEKPSEAEAAAKKAAEEAAAAAEKAGEDDKDDAAPEADEPKPDPKAAEYEAFYKKVMAPFKANGKVIQLQSPEEVIQLMQMGANFTKKMQAIQKDRKFLLMLEQNGLLDENEISFYIDLKKRDPEAIKKFLKDAKIDPVDIDTSGEVHYKKKNHVVSDQEANLHTAIEDVSSSEGGKETLQSIHETWDEASKKDLWEHPELLSIIHNQRGNGMYAAITAEMERRRILGQLSPRVPFLKAYKMIGDELAAKGALPGIKPATPAKQPVARTPVAKRPAISPATKAANDAKAKAAAAPRTVSRPAKSSVNFLAMSDDEFNKLSNKV